MNMEEGDDNSSLSVIGQYVESGEPIDIFACNRTIVLNIKNHIEDKISLEGVGDKLAMELIITGIISCAQNKQTINKIHIKSYLQAVKN